MAKKLLLILLLITLSSLVLAADEIVQEADRLNFWNAETHTITVYNNGVNDTEVTIVIPAGYTWNSGTCSHAAGTITCDVAAGGSENYLIDSSAGVNEYSVGTFSPTTNNSFTGNDVKLLRIEDDEIFHTLVEYGRGRGNYFFDTYGSGTAGSGHTGTGCNYLPNGTFFELNFLHKVNNIKQYFGDLTALAYNATFYCTYPNDTIVRQHLVEGIITNTSGAYVNYRIKKIEGSWERMGYMGMDFENYMIGQSIDVNCSNITYYFPTAGGYFYVPEDSFSLEIRGRDALTATATTLTTIGNGTQEVIITYNITNTEQYTIDDVIIEINAPPYAIFIGTRGELWGAGLDQYRIEKAQLLPGESEIIQLVARFDTTSASGISSIDLTQGVRIKYTTCWELNAYNPTEYVQNIRNIGNGTVNLNINTTIIDVIDRIKKIVNITKVINNTVFEINETVTNIQTIVNIINQTTQDTNIIVKQINQTTFEILNISEIVVENTFKIKNDTQYIIDLLNCNGTIDTPICDKIQDLNLSLQNLYNFSLVLNYTAHNINITNIDIDITGINVTVNVDLDDIINQLRTTKTFINCTNASSQPNGSVCRRLELIENSSLIINSSLNSLFNLTTFFNTSIFGNYTFQDILNEINNISVDTTLVLESLRELREFNEEVVFLITDSFGLQQQAKSDFLSGDVGSAMEGLSEANLKLQQAAGMLSADAGSGDFDTSWVLIGLILIAAVGLVSYLAKPVEPKKGNLWMFAFVFLLLGVGSVQAAEGFGPLGTINQFAQALNFGDDPQDQTIDIYYNCTGSRLFNVTLPAGFTVTNTIPPCGLITGSLISCSFNDVFAGDNFGGYTIKATSNFTDHAILTFPTWLSNTTECTYNNLSFINLPDEEIFHTLVEYGRGRGNYFFSTRGGAGSGGTGVGCNYVPNGTLFELNFLHKIFNINQYFNNASLYAENVSFMCTYPNRSIVRSHQGTSILTGANTTISYFIDRLTSDWERMGYVGMQFDEDEQYVGQNLTVSCSNISYFMPGLSGKVQVFVNGTTFNLEVRDPDPFEVNALTTTIIGNGTQEVVITYNITNTEEYVVDDVIIEINAPPYSTFIGTRGELWGAGQDQYRIEKAQLLPGESEIIQLVARFDTTNAPNINSVDLTRGVRIKYITCWNLNAYNPGESVQNIVNIGNGTVNMSVSSSVVNVQQTLVEIYNFLTVINSTTTNIRNTVNNIEYVVTIINSTTYETNIIVREINTTVNRILDNVTLALNNTYMILDDTNTIKDLLNCNGTVDTPICSQLDTLNITVTNITDILIDINTTLNNLSINVSLNLTSQNLTFNVTPDLTNITIIIEDIQRELNCSVNWTIEPNESICWRLRRIQNNTGYIENSVNNITNIFLSFNNSIFGNVSLQQIINNIKNTTVDTTDLLTEIRRMREFSEELVFLVTDAFGLQKAANEDIVNGDLGAAADKLREANAKLNQAAAELMAQQQQVQSISETEANYIWVLTILSLIAAVGLGYYLFSVPKE